MTHDTFTRTDRQQWLSVLAHAPRSELERCAAPAVDGMCFDWLRAPETGLTMVRARIGNSGDRFNLGEATVTRCVARYHHGSGCVTVGVGYVLGREAQRSRWVAQMDALLQQPAHHAHCMRTVIEPLRAATRTQRDAARRLTDTSRVRFFTLKPEVSA